MSIHAVLRNHIDQFIGAHCYRVNGELISFADFFSRFVASLPAKQRRCWSRIDISRALPTELRPGSYSSNRKYLPNLSWQPAEHKQPFVTIDGDKFKGRARILVKA